MNSTLARRLISLYPRPWRERYGAEFEALLILGGGGFGAFANVLFSAIREHMFPTPGLARDGLAMNGLAMNNEHRLSGIELLFVRAPWAMFGLLPLVFLAAAYFLACFVLWSGWRIFLPQTTMPFVPVTGLASYYFGAGRLLYLTAPVLVGWGVAFMAARLRLNIIWPTVGLILLAIIGGSAQVYVNRSPGEGGHVGMGLGFAHFGVFHPLAILALTVVPYAALKFTSRRSASV